MGLEERLGSLVEGAEMGTLNLGSMNFGDEVFLNARPDVVRVAARLRQRGLVPECEAYDAGMLDTLRWLLEHGHLARPYHVQFVLGVPGGMAASERNLRFLVEGLPEARWSSPRARGASPRRRTRRGRSSGSTAGGPRCPALPCLDGPMVGG
jgi:3-keto-5-aminohexanoate cleavage enzyme